MFIPSDLMAEDDLADWIASFVSAGVNDGVTAIGSRWNCPLSCILDLSPARRIGGGLHWWANLLAIFLASR